MALPPMPGAPRIADIERSIDTVPWAYLTDAYRSTREAPVELRAFIRHIGSDDAPGGDVDWLDGAILHQGSVYSASPAVVWVLTDLLAAAPDHPDAGAILNGVQTLVEALQHFEQFGDSHDVPYRRSAPGDPPWETWVDRPVALSDPVGDDYFAASNVTASVIRDTVAHAVPVVRHLLELAHRVDHGGPAPWGTAAVGTWCTIARVLPVGPTELWRTVGDGAFTPGAWLSAVITLDALGENVAPLLSHADRRLRLAAAMAAGTTSNSRSTVELAAALTDLEWLEATFPDDLADRAMHLRFHVGRALRDRLRRDAPNDVALAALGHMIRARASIYTVDVEWGPLLHWAFAERRIDLPRPANVPRLPDPDRLTPAQRTILTAIVAKAELWDRTSGNADLAFMRVQLTYDRQAMVDLLAQTAPPDRS